MNRIEISKGIHWEELLTAFKLCEVCVLIFSSFRSGMGKFAFDMRDMNIWIWISTQIEDTRHKKGRKTWDREWQIHACLNDLLFDFYFSGFHVRYANGWYRICQSLCSARCSAQNDQNWKGTNYYKGSVFFLTVTGPKQKLAAMNMLTCGTLARGRHVWLETRLRLPPLSIIFIEIAKLQSKYLRFFKKTHT